MASGPNQPVVTLPTPSPATGAMLAKSGKLAAAICADHQIRIWSLPEARLLRTLDLGDRNVAINLMPDDGRWILIADYAGRITVWNTSTGETQLEQRFDNYLGAAAFSHDGRWLAMAPGPEPVRVVDLESKRVLYRIEDAPPGPVAIAFSGDGELLATSDAEALRFFDGATGKAISKNSDFLLVPLAIAFTRDGRQAAAAGGDKVISVIETATGKTLRRTRKSGEAVFYLEVSGDGNELAAVTLKADNMSLPSPIVVWDIATLQKKAEWVPPPGALSAAWTADGHFIAATATPEALKLWRVR